MITTKTMKRGPKQKFYPNAPKTRVPLKWFLHEEAERTKLDPVSILSRIHRGCYTNIMVEHINKRVVFVSPQSAQATER